MLIAGAKGHAKEILGIFAELNQDKNINFFDDLISNTDHFVFNNFKILKTEEEVRELFKHDNRFVIGVGNPSLRQQLKEKLQFYGGELVSIISPKADIGKYSVVIENGVNIFTRAVVTQNISIGEGVLLHINSVIHHDCTIGKYSSISDRKSVV